MNAKQWTPMNQKEKLIKEDGVGKVDEAHFRSLIGSNVSYIHKARHLILIEFDVKIHALCQWIVLEGIKEL